MFILARALVYATLFIAFLMVFLPGQVMRRFGFVAPARIGAVEILAGALVVAGGALVLWSILAFVFVGKGTPAPFDPPRKLVIVGPYRWVRNPIYVGAVVALGGAALFYRSLSLLLYGALGWLVLHLLVVLYEEPALRRSFGAEYQAYCARVGRWWPQSIRATLR